MLPKNDKRELKGRDANQQAHRNQPYISDRVFQHVRSLRLLMVLSVLNKKCGSICDCNAWSWAATSWRLSSTDLSFSR